MKIVMFVDGSLASSGVAIGRCEFKGLPEIIHLERVKTKTSQPMETRLASLFTRICDLIRKFNVELMIMEEKFVGKNVKTALAIGRADGAIQAAAGVCGIRVGTLENGQIKFSLTNFKHAEKEQVMYMVTQIFKDQPIVLKYVKPENIGKKGAPKQDDIADAIGGLYTYNAQPMLAKEA